MTKMKDSGNPWVGVIPTDWQERKLRHLVNLRGEKAKTIDSSLYVGMENIKSNTGEYISTEIQVDNTENASFDKGDILFGKLRPYLRKYWLATFAGTASSEFLVFKEGILNQKFLYWLIQSDSFINDVDSSTYGSKMPRASWDYIKNILVPFPFFSEEQEKIANFLVKKVSQLDKAKALLEEQIKTLEDYRQSLIYETVTKGLDKTVPMKESGVYWIGEIPEGWEVKPIKYIFEIIGSGTTPDSSKSEFYDGDVNWIQSGDLYKTDFVDNVSKTITELGYRSSASLKIYEAPFLAIAMYGASIGNLAISRIDACVNQAVAVLKSNEDIVRFSKYALEVSKKELITAAQGGTQPNINQITIKNWSLPLPNNSEMVQIAEYLDDKAEQLNKLIEIKQRQIENIDKQRQTLIYDYVTGKRRV